VELYLHSPNTPSWSGAQLKHRENFTFIIVVVVVIIIIIIIIMTYYHNTTRRHNPDI
jgi:competence protein ComGC